MPTTRSVRLCLSLAEAEALSQLAAEADPETFTTTDGPRRARILEKAGMRAMDKLASAIADTGRHPTSFAP